MGSEKRVAKLATNRLAQRLAGRVDRVGVDLVHALREQRVAWDQDRLALERRVERVGVKGRGNCIDDGRRVGTLDASAGDQSPHHQFLDRFEPRKRVRVGLRETLEFARTTLNFDDYGGG